MWKKNGTAIGLAISLAATGPAWAHHSIAMFDFAKEQTLTGVIESFEYTNPHSWIKLQVTGAEGKVEAWGLEGMSPNALTRAGWTKNTLKPGDKVSIQIHPLRDPSLKGGFAVTVTLPDGKVMHEFPSLKPAAKETPAAKE